jgi:tetratricopeptide (TPR) repeat protein
MRAYRNQSYAEAQELFSLISAKQPLALVREHCQFGIGAAAYRSGDFDTAKEAFSQALLSRDRSLQEKSHYNLANALFESGRVVLKAERETAIAQWEAALEHYDLALALNAGNTAAKQNRKFVEDLLNKLANEPPPQPEDKPEPEPDEPKQDQDKPDEQKKNPPPDKAEPPKPDEKPPQPEEPNKPDDPKDGEDDPPAPEDSPEQKPPQRPWNPSQARQILEQNAGEDLKAKPVQTEPYASQPFKNW